MKIIHKGPKYTVSVCAGPGGALQAVKTAPGEDERRMDFFPERDVAPLAGEADERTAWTLLADVARELDKNSATPVCPAHILIDRDGAFRLSPWSRSQDPAFTAPEGYEPVWALGASVFFLVLGCPVFYGLGGAAQGPSTPVPTLRRSWSGLSALINRCLSFEPSARPEVKEIYSMAIEALGKLPDLVAALKPEIKGCPAALHDDELEALWPEKID